METNPETLTFREVTAPLSIDQIKEHFTQKNLMFIIDVSKSQLKDHALITYLSNLEIPCELSFVNSSKAEVKSLVKSYMESKSLVNSNNLKFLSAQIVLDSVGYDSDSLFENALLNKDERKSFINDNSKLVDSWAQFVSSSVVFAVSSYPALEEHFQFKNSIPQINDPDVVGFNVVNLFSIPGFMESFYSQPQKFQPQYYKSQFDDYIYKGKNFFHY
ncbi:MAG: hypothetical protein ACK5V3_05865, partial [Bdellovibrionales bacterium]